MGTKQIDAFGRKVLAKFPPCNGSGPFNVVKECFRRKPKIKQTQSTTTLQYVFQIRHRTRSTYFVVCVCVWFVHRFVVWICFDDRILSHETKKTQTRAMLTRSYCEANEWIMGMHNRCQWNYTRSRTWLFLLIISLLFCECLASDKYTSSACSPVSNSIAVWFEFISVQHFVCSVWKAPKPSVGVEWCISFDKNKW